MKYKWVIKKQIEKPFKVNHKLYGFITGISMLGIAIAFWCFPKEDSFIGDIIKNISFGCFASTIIAWLLEIYAIRQKNQKADQLYEAVYSGLKIQIRFYIETWGRICESGFKRGKNESYTWTEWYVLCEKLFKEESSRKKELLSFFTFWLGSGVDGINRELQKIKEQEYVLAINDVYDENMRSIVHNFAFEFEQKASMLHNKNIDENEFWSTMDALNLDIKRYIKNWVDISWYNELPFIPGHFGDNIEERIQAMKTSGTIVITERNSVKLIGKPLAQLKSQFKKCYDFFRHIKDKKSMQPYGFNMKKEFEIYKNIGVKGQKHNYKDWEEYLVDKYNKETYKEKTLLNFIHYLKQEQRKVSRKKEIWKSIIMPLAVMIVTIVFTFLFSVVGVINNYNNAINTLTDDDFLKYIGYSVKRIYEALEQALYSGMAFYFWAMILMILFTCFVMVVMSSLIGEYNEKEIFYSDYIEIIEKIKEDQATID